MMNNLKKGTMFYDPYDAIVGVMINPAFPSNYDFIFFDVPVSLGHTYADRINESGAIVGSYTISGSLTKGYIKTGLNYTYIGRLLCFSAVHFSVRRNRTRTRFCGTAAPCFGGPGFSGQD